MQYAHNTSWTAAIHINNATGYTYDAATDTIMLTSNINALHTKLMFSYPSLTDAEGIVVAVNEAIN